MVASRPRGGWAGSREAPSALSRPTMALPEYSSSAQPLPWGACLPASMEAEQGQERPAGKLSVWAAAGPASPITLQPSDSQSALQGIRAVVA